MDASICPSEQQLEAFLLGNLPAAGLQAVAAHLENCAPCQALVQRLDDEFEPLPSAVLDPAVATAMESTRILSPGARTAASQRAGNDAYSFLRPPEGPDEIGRLGNYRVLSLLGKGGMAFVFLAEDVALSRPVALKVLKPDLSPQTGGWHRIFREARIMASIKHENLVTIYHVGQEGPVVCLAMELLEGEALCDRMQRVGRFAVPEILRLAREIATGLAVVHRHGFIHRDIKPANIWLESPRDRVKILDFGLARFVNDNTDLTQPGTIMGTPAFMSPEQARGEKADARSDLFSLGAILYSLCTGVKPFGSDNTMAVLTALAVSNPLSVHELNADIPRALCDLVMQLLEKIPNDRPASADAVLERLRLIETWLEDPTAATEPTRPTSSSLQDSVKPSSSSLASRPRRARLALAGIGLGVLLVVALLVLGGPLGWFRERVHPRIPGVVYVRELELVEPVHWPPPAMPGPPPRVEPPNWPPALGGVRVKVARTVSPSGIFMHLPPHGGATRISFLLHKRFDSFASGVSLNDGPQVSTPLTFTVYGDGRPLWQSELVSTQKNTQATPSLSVADVHLLTLEVTGAGDSRGAHAVWIEPHLRPSRFD